MKRQAPQQCNEAGLGIFGCEKRISSCAANENQAIKAINKNNRGRDLSVPNDSEFIYKKPYGGKLWQLQICTFNGELRASFMPWYDSGDGDYRPDKFVKGGVQFSIEDVLSLCDAIIAWRQRNNHNPPPEKG